MTTIDILMLKILAEKNHEKSVKEIQEKLRDINVNLCQRGIYQRLKRLQSHRLINKECKKQIKLYKISEAGKFSLTMFQNQLSAS